MGSDRQVTVATGAIALLSQATDADGRQNRTPGNAIGVRGGFRRGLRKALATRGFSHPAGAAAFGAKMSLADARPARGMTSQNALRVHMDKRQRGRRSIRETRCSPMLAVSVVCV